MPNARFSLLRLCFIVSIWAATIQFATVDADDRAIPKGAENWADFIHYVLIALPERAAEQGDHLLQVVGDDNIQLLNIVEQGPYPDYESTLERAMKIKSVKDVATRLARQIQTAKIQLIRNPERMAQDIQKLKAGGRIRVNALARLKEAGQFAAPQLLATLLSEKPNDRDLHAHVMAAIVAIGRPMVYPLSVAVAELEPVQMGQVAQILTDIGYPLAAPFIKAVLESLDLDLAAREKVNRTYFRLAGTVQLPDNVTGADLFLTLGANMYTKATHRDGASIPGYDIKTKKGIVWSYDRRAGLVATPVPGHVFGDVLAMQAAQRAMQLNPNLNRALSLWLMANLRRQNRLTEDELDPSYPAAMLPPQFYIEMAGPLRQHDVLEQAMQDADVPLALNAIDALDATAGTDALIKQEGAIQPLLNALSYPDRRIRFAAAFALTQARPRAQFPGSYRVVPVLTEAVRQAGTRQALVIGRDEDSVNNLVASVKQLAGYEAIGGLSSTDPIIIDLIKSGPGIDVIVTNLSHDRCVALMSATVSDYHLTAAPILALVSRGDQIELQRMFPGKSRITWDGPQLERHQLSTAIDRAIQSMTGKPITEDQADQYAHRAIELLRQIAVSRGEVFNVLEAQPSLIAALNDPRQSIVQRAGQVLALLDDSVAQQALAKAALDQTRASDVRISLLNSLALSAKHFGNQLTQPLIERMLEMVMTSRDQLAIAAARAHGALALPTSHLKQMIEQ